MTPELACTAYTILGMKLEAVGLLSDKWLPTNPPDACKEDRELVEVFQILERATIQTFGVQWTEKNAMKLNGAIEVLPDKQKHLNRTLLGLHLAREWAQRNVGPTAMMLRTKTTRIIDAVAAEVRKHAGEDTARFTYRAADNLVRWLDGRPLLDEEVRNAFFKRIHKKKKEVEDGQAVR